MKTSIKQDIAIRETEFGKGTYTLRDIKKGELVFYIEGKMVYQPSKYTIQVDKDRHIYPVIGKYLNHSCIPNGMFNMADQSFMALSDIKAGDELTFNYNTTEYELASPFECRCGNTSCYKTIKGFKYLSEKQKEEIMPLLSEYLATML